MKNKLLNYKGYFGSIEFELEDRCLIGQILHINDMITYQADTLPELEKEFQIAVDDYLELCKELKREPQKPFKGSFNVRITPEVHKELALRAKQNECSINEVVKQAIGKYLDEESKEVIHNHRLNII